MQARGLFALSCVILTASMATAGQQFKFVDLNVWASSGIATKNNGIQINKINRDGTIAFGSNYGPTSNPSFAEGVRLASGAMRWQYEDRNLPSSDSHGNYVTNGGTSVLGYYDYNTGGTVRYADGSEYVLPPLGTNPYACARDINDSGIVVGHYSFYKFTTYVEFNGGQPFYMKNGVIMKPFGDNFYGTFCGVDKYGRALLASGGYWSPDEEFVHSSYLYGGDYSYRNDFNDNLQTLSLGNDPIVGYETAAIDSMNSRQVLPYPSFVPADWAEINAGGLNNFGKVVTSYRRKIVNNQWQWQWCYWNGTSWEDLYTAVKPQVPAGWLFDKVADIDDFGRVYGTMKKPDGSMTIVRLDPVPEPATLATLALGALVLLRRKNSTSTRAA